MVTMRPLQTILLIALIGLCLFATHAEARRRAPSPPKPRLTPILECVVINKNTYTAYFGYENEDGTSSNVTVDTDDNKITGIGLGFRWGGRQPWHFDIWRVVPGRPGRSPLYPNAVFSIEMPLFSIAIWNLCGRILLITQWGPKCSTPDQTAPVFTTPSKCPATYTIPTTTGTVNGEWSYCFKAVDTDTEGGLTWSNTFDPQEDSGCLDSVDILGLGAHQGSVTVRDRCGNPRTCDITVIVVDQEKPVITCPASFTASITDPLAEKLTIGQVVAVKAVATDNNPASPITYSWRGTTNSWSGSQCLSGNSQFAAASYAYGKTYLSFSAKDNAGNTGTCSSTVVTIIDGAKPIFRTCPAARSYTQGASIPAIYAKAYDTLTTVTLTVQRTSPSGVITSGRTATEGCKNDAQLDGSLGTNNQQVTFPVGTTTLVFTAVDDAGNVETCTTTVTIIGTTPAFQSCPVSQNVNTNLNSQYGTPSSVTATAPAGFSVSASVTYPSSSSAVTVVGSDVSNLNYPVGITNVVFKATQGAVTIYCATISITVKDIQPPTLDCPATAITLFAATDVAYATDLSSIVATGHDNNKVTVTFSSADIAGGIAVQGSAVGATSASAVSVVPSGVTTLALGNYTVKWTATDGVSSVIPTCTTVITVLDNQKPKFTTCPSSLVYTVASGAEFVTVTAAATTVVATDNNVVTSITRNDGVVTSSVVADLYAPTLASGLSSVVYSYTFTAADAAIPANTQTCSFTITINALTYCTSTTCGSTGVCSQTTGSNGVATNYVCDCSSTFCYAASADCRTSDGSYPFPPSPTLAVATVAGCDGATISADTSTCMYQAFAAGAQNLARSWQLISSTSQDNDNYNLVAGILSSAGSADSVSFGATDLIGGVTYVIRLLYVHTPTNGQYFADQTLVKQSGNSPTVSITGPPYPWQLVDGDTTTQFQLTGTSLTCGASTSSPQYSWTSVPALSCNLMTNLPYLVVPFSCSGLVMNANTVFTLTVTDLNGVTGSNTFSVMIVPAAPHPPDCQVSTSAPTAQIVANPGADGEENVVLGAQCGAASLGGCFLLNNIPGTDINVFDGTGCVDPRSCNVAQTPLSYRWEFFYPPTINNGIKYTAAGITGYTDPVVKIAPNSFPALASLDVFWRVRLTLTSTVTTNPLSTIAIFRFKYVQTQLTLQISSDCQSPINIGATCSIAAGAPVPAGTVTSGAFAVQDASEWTYSWAAQPSVDLTDMGADSSVLQIPTTLLAGTYYVFTVTATKAALVATKSMTLYVATSQPSGGSFVVSPAVGTALTQPFLVASTGWTSGAGALTYAWKYIVGEDVVGAVEESLTSLGWKSSSSVFLPAGRITIVAYIYAQDGTFVRRSQTITVAEQTTTNRACWVLDMVNTLLAQAEEQQNMATTLQLVSYLADYLKAPELQGVTSLTCNGVDQTAAIQGIRGRFLTLLQKLSNQPMDNTQASMLTTAMNKVISNAQVIAITPTEAVTAASMLSSLINGMTTSAGNTEGANTNIQTQVLSLVSQLVGWIEDCTVLDTLAVDMRKMFVAANAKGMAGSTSVYMAGDNVVYGSQTVWANIAQSASMGDIAFNFPAGALTSSTSDFNINMINYLNAHVRACRATDITGKATTVSSSVLSIEIVQARDNSVVSVSGLATPITFTLPIRSDVDVVPECGAGAGQLTCAWWDAANSGWSTAGCQTMNAAATTASGASGVQCACSHLTEFAIIRPTTTCMDKSILRGFRGTVAVYIILFAVVFGLFCRTIRQTHLELREALLFTFLGSVACALRIALTSHYAQFITFPVGVVDVLAVIPYAILYWINGHYFAAVRIQRIESTEARVRWRVEPILRLVLVGVFLGVLALLAGIGLDATSQAKMADVVSRLVALAYTIANTIFFGYACTIMAGFASGRSDIALTRAMAVMSFATLMESIFWCVYPTNGYALFPATVCDLIALGVMIYRYRSPMDDKAYLSSRSGHRDASEALVDDDERPDLASPLSMGGPRSSQFVGVDSPRRPSTQLSEPPMVDGQA